MKSIISFSSYIGLVIILFCFSNCQKDEFNFDESRDLYIKPINPAEEPERLSQYLQIEGTYHAGELPAGQFNSNITITNSQNSASISNGSVLHVPFTFSSQELISAIYLQVVGAESYWHIPITTSTVEGNHVFGVGIPIEVLQGAFSFRYAIEDQAGNVSYPVNLQTNVKPPVIACENDQPYYESGSDGLTVRRVILNNAPGEIELYYEMYSLPDRLDVWYNNQWVASTANQLLDKSGYPPPSVCYDGTSGYVPGQGSLTFDYDPQISTEIVIYMSGCFGGTAWDLYLGCNEGCNSGNAPQLFSDEITFNANQNGRLTTYINVDKDDYVFISTSGGVILGQDYLTGNVYSSAIGISGTAHQKPYQDYRFGQLIAHIGNQDIPFQNIDLKGDDCENILGDNFFVDALYFSGELGNYFIAKESGTLSFSINDFTFNDNTGKYKIEVFKLSKEQHINRNCFNKCPNLRPQNLVDNMGYKWVEDGILDDSFEECYHGGNEDFRGESLPVIGCQCVYDNQANLINIQDLQNLGSFDYGYFLAHGDVRTHFILDVFPHLIYLSENPNLLYAPIPESNIY